MKAVVVFLLLIGANAFAGTDYNCVNKCTAEGMMYQFCQSKCSYNDSAAVNFNARTDYTCVSKCTAEGNMYSYCKDRCSY